jgi:VWFA-related protein
VRAYTELVSRGSALLRHTAGAAVVAVCTVTVSAQQPSQQRPRFTSAVDVVSVDVNVIDADGRPVRDLTANDFTVTVDGQRRRIVSAQFVSLTAPGAADTPVPPEDYTTNVAAGAPGRLIAIVIDRGSIAPVRAKDVFGAAARFVGTLQPQDRVGLFSIPEGPNVDFTTDHEAVAVALLHSDGAAHGSSSPKYVGVAEAVAIERGNTFAMENVTERECGGRIQSARDAQGNSELSMCVRLIQDEAATVATYAHQRARDSVSGLAGILKRLGTSETPKTIVWVSEGLVVDNERFVTNSLGPLLAAAHATIFALKPEPSASDASRQRAPQNEAQERAVKETGLVNVAHMSGGEMFRVLADPDFSFKRLATELSGYYLIGFEPETRDRDGKQHKIGVDVRRSGVTVRARAEFTVEPAGTPADTQRIMTDLLRSPAVATSIPFRLTTYTFQDPESTKVRLLVGIETERPDAGRLAMGLALIKPDGASAATFYQPSIEAPGDSATQTYFATIVVEPGGYILKAALLDAKGHRGSLERQVRAYMTRMSRFRATQLLIGDAKQPDAGAGTVAPTVSGNFSGETLHTYMELFADAPAAFEGASVRVDVLPAGGTRPVESAPAILQPAGSDANVRAAAASVAIALLPAGAYVAHAVVTVDGHQVGDMARPFRIVRSTGHQ